jgi:hypothetical protein
MDRSAGLEVDAHSQTSIHSESKTRNHAAKPLMNEDMKSHRPARRDISIKLTTPNSLCKQHSPSRGDIISH